MHAVAVYSDQQTLCGIYVSGWSRFYLTAPQPVISCKRCLAKSGFVPSAEIPVRHLAIASRTGT